MMPQTKPTLRVAAYVARIIAISALTAGALAGQPAGHWGSTLSESGLPKWKAQWIWLPDDSEAEMLLARRAFHLPEVPEWALLSITATSRYQLFVNGKYICCGPARSAAHHQSFDVLDLSDRLHQGANVVAVRVHFQREDVSYYGTSRAGLLAQLDATSASPLTTDASWRVAADESWLKSSPRMARFHLEVCDRADLRRQIRGWTDVEFDDAKWQPAQVLRREGDWPLPQPDDRPTHLIPPWTSLIPRDIPYLKESISTPRQLVDIGSIAQPQDEGDFLNNAWAEAPVIPQIPVTVDGPDVELHDGPITIAANEPNTCRVIVYDQGEVHNGRPFLDVTGPRGTVVDIISAPYLLDESVRSPIVASTYVDRIVLSGNRERWEAFYFKPTRWLVVAFRYLPGDAQVYSAGLKRIEYPFVQTGSFHTPDCPELQTLWQAAVRTVQVCTTDAYTDNYRERRQYAQTAYYACLGNDPVFGDTALQRRYLTQIADEQLPNGIMPAYAPRHGDDFMVILDSNCLWVRGLHQYLLYSGDGDTTRSLQPAARRLLGLLHSYTNDDGLIDSPPYPYWLDHAVNDRRGANFCLNGHYLGALEDFAQVLEWLDERDAALYQQRAAIVRQTLGEKAWDPQRRLFADAIVDGQRSHEFSEHANAMAIVLSVGTPEQRSAVAAQLSQSESHDFVRRASGIVMVTPAMSYFLHAGLCEAGYAEQFWDLLRTRFAHMLSPSGNGTLWEEWWLDKTGRSGTVRPFASGRSDAQTESAFFPGLFARYILGIDPVLPGLRDVVLRYYPSSQLPRRRGTVPTPSGILGVAWEITPSDFEIALQVPKNTTVHVELASLKVTSSDHILLDGKPA